MNTVTPTLSSEAFERDERYNLLSWPIDADSGKLSRKSGWGTIAGDLPEPSANLGRVFAAMDSTGDRAQFMEIRGRMKDRAILAIVRPRGWES